MKIFKLDTGFLHAEVVIILTDDFKAAGKWLRRREGEAFEWDECPQATSFDIGKYYVFLPEPPLRPGLIAHELSHAVSMLLEDYGIKDDETRSFLLDDITDQFYRKIKSRVNPNLPL